MKKIFIFFTAIILMTSVTYKATAQTFPATAQCLTSISIAENVNMNFGNIAVSASTAGTVTLAATSAGTRTTGGAGGVTLPAVTGTFAAAKFTVTGDGSSTYTFSISPSSLTLSSSSNTMSLGTFTNNLSSGVGTLAAGTQIVYVGATLIISAAQPAGVYTSGTPMTATVNYN